VEEIIFQTGMEKILLQKIFGGVMSLRLPGEGFNFFSILQLGQVEGSMHLINRIFWSG